MTTPKEMKVTMVFDDGSQQEICYKLNALRSGDNPHQAGFVGEPGGSYFEAIEGRGMGFTNHIDLIGYWVAMEISQTMAFLKDDRTEAVVINKHTNPAVFAARSKQLDALLAALETDKNSPFGGVMCTSSPLSLETADFLVKKNHTERFVLDVLAAPGFFPGSSELLAQAMKNLRIVDVSRLNNWNNINPGVFGYNMKWTIGGKPILTEIDCTSFFNTQYSMETLSYCQPDEQDMKDACIAWIGAKAIQSNSFAFVKNAVLLAQCGGQTKREDSAKFAKIRADEFGVSLEGSTAATDSFLFDYKSVDILHSMGVRTIIHPTRKNLTTGNFKPDLQILAKVDEYKMIMLRPYLIDVSGKEAPWRVFRHL
jgi:phosphoribosylaminoimidazolecarboxamide formyltransferase / IMP cyclohydrolase